MVVLMIRNLSRAISWHRRKLAAMAAVIAVLATIAAARPAPPPTVEVVVASADLPGGKLLAEGDLEVARFPKELAPGGVVDRDALVGRTLNAALTTGTPVTSVAVLGDTTGVGPGQVVAPVKFADPALVALLRAGDTIDVIAAGPDGGQVVAAGVRVVTVPQSTDSGPGSGQSAMVLLAVSPELATTLAGAATMGQLSLVLS